MCVGVGGVRVRLYVRSQTTWSTTKDLLVRVQASVMMIQMVYHICSYDLTNTYTTKC